MENNKNKKTTKGAAVYFMSGYRSLAQAHHRFTDAIEHQGHGVVSYDMAGHGSNAYGKRGEVYFWHSVCGTYRRLRDSDATVAVGHSCGALFIVIGLALLRILHPSRHRQIAAIHLVNPAFNTGHNVAWYVHYIGLVVGLLLPKLKLGSLNIDEVTDHPEVQKCIEDAKGVYRGEMTARTALRIYFTGKVAMGLLLCVGTKVCLHVGERDPIAKAPWQWYQDCCKHVSTEVYDMMHDGLDRPRIAPQIIRNIVTDVETFQDICDPRWKLGAEAWVKV